MILHSVKLQGCRCFRNPITVGPFSEGINLLVGPNEAGKSTLVEAVARALFDRYNASGQTLSTLQPWGSNLSPEITLELAEGSAKYRLTKRLLSNPKAELERWEGGSYQRLLEDAGADEFIRGLTLSEAQERGVSKPAQWGLARTLWFLQRCPVEEAGASEALRDRLQEALGARPASPERGAMGGKIEGHYSAVFTATGRLAQQSSLTQALAQRAEAQGRLDELQTQYEQALERETELEALQGEHQRVGEERAEAEARARELESLVEGLKEQRRELAQAATALATAALERERLEVSVKKHRVAEAKLAEAKLKRGDLERELQAATIQKAAATRLREEAQATARERKAAYEQAQETLERARGLKRARDLAASERSLKEMVSQLEQLDDELRRLGAAYEQRVWPGRAEVDTARALQTQVQVEQARLEAVGLSVEVALERTQEVTVTTEGQTEEYRGEAGDTRVFLAGQTAEIVLPGVAHLRVRSGAEETAEVSGRVQAAEASLAEALGKFGCATVEDLAERYATGEGQQQRIKDLQKDSKRLAGEHKTLAQTRSALAETTNKLETALAGLELTAEALAEMPALDEARLASAAHNAEAARNDADGVLQRRQEELETAITAENDCRKAVSDADGEQSGYRTTLETLLAAFGCTVFAELEGKLAQVTAKEATLREQVDTVTASLPDELADPEAQLVTAREALASLDKSTRKLEDDILTTTNRLQAAREGDPYGRKLVVEEELQRLEAEVSEQLLRGGAVRLLKQLYDARREGMAAPWADLEDRCTRMLTAITGRARGVRLSAECGLEQASDGGEWADCNQLSSGAQEQLRLAYRLALGEAYADQFGRQMLVLDDVLVYTDPERHKRILEILKIGAEKLQIFILTSHVGFYRGLVADEFSFDIPALARGE